MEEEREKLAETGEVTGAASGSRNPEMEAEPQSAEVEMRKEEMGISKKQYMEDVSGNWWNATMDGERETEAWCTR